MSLINDALKRAKSAQKQASPSLAEDTSATPVERPVPSENKSSVLVVSVSLLLAGLAGWFFWQWWSSPSQKPIAKAPVATPAKPATNNVLAHMVATITNAVASRQNPDLIPFQQPATNAAPSGTPAATAEKPVVVPATNAVPVSPTTVTSTEPLPPKAATVQTETFENPAPPKSAGFPALKLQAIYYRLVKPSALINSKTLYLGDTIEGAKVVKIERQRVLVEIDGKTKDLILK